MEAKTQPAKSDLAEGFERLYYAEVDPEELAARSARDLAGAAASHLESGRRFSSGKPKIRAYNPTPAQHGWQSTHTAIEIVNDDMPFLVDSVTMEVNRQGLTLHLVIHPVLRAVRDAKGELLSIFQPSESSEGRLESFMHIEVDRQTDAAKLVELEAGIARVLADVRAAVEDWNRCRRAWPRSSSGCLRTGTTRSAPSSPGSWMTTSRSWAAAAMTSPPSMARTCCASFRAAALASCASAARPFPRASPRCRPRRASALG